MQPDLQVAWPWALLLLAAIPVLAWLRRRRPGAAFVFNKTSSLASTRRQRHAYLPWAARAGALAIVIVAMAQPEWGARTERIGKRGIGIEIVIDRSGSMDSELDSGGKKSRRLDVVKKATEAFVFGDGGRLKGRPSDLIGLMEFAADPVTLSPLTLSHEQLRPLIESIRPARGVEDGTAIGDAIAVAAARFEVAAKSGAALKSKVILLLTDGENNMGRDTPMQAAELAKKWGVRVYALGMRDKGMEAIEETMSADLDVLSISTGGFSRLASDGNALRGFYDEIDRLEPADVSGVIPRPGRRYLSAMAAAALGLLTMAAALEQTVLRRIP